MRTSITKRRLLFAAIIALAALVVGAEAYLLSPDVRRLAVGCADRAGAAGRLTSLAADPDKDVREAAQAALVRRGENAVPALVRGLDAPDPFARSVAANVLGRIGPAARPAVPALTERMRSDPDSQVRTVAAEALNAIAGNDPDTIAEFVRLLETGDEAGRSLAAKTLSARGDHALVVVPALVHALRDPVPQVRQEAAEALEQLGSKAKQAIPALVEALGDSNSGVRKEAAEALEQITAGLGKEDAPLRDLGRAALERAKGETVPPPRP